ncbi:MAG TPA: nuclear transport factor 2 family protein [Opitutaceae bacterium]|nr:nuclear transport factor 2 family protein [Opitutaceae bacterium]
MLRALLPCLALAVSAPAAESRPAAPLDLDGFCALAGRLAAAWNANDARTAADAFTEDAIYTEPPDRQVYRGREALFRFFGGEKGRATAMRMTWHHLSFNPVTQVGAGEFTFAWPGGQVHGMVSIRVRDGKIERWREYFREAALEWEEFQGVNRF